MDHPHPQLVERQHDTEHDARTGWNIVDNQTAAFYSGFYGCRTKLNNASADNIRWKGVAFVLAAPVRQLADYSYRSKRGAHSAPALAPACLADTTSSFPFAKGIMRTK